MRIALFTDTLNDVNGVSRFIRNVGHQAFVAEPRRSLHLITSTRFAPPPIENGSGGATGGTGAAAGVPEHIHNLKPIYARAMPGYPQLDIVVAPKRGLWRLARELRPDVIHVSTPGPVGMAGRAIAKRLGVPLVGTYHTDFPAYVDHLFNDPTMTLMTTAAMRRFYRPFGALFTRSADYGEALVRMGYPRERIVRLLPGIDTGVFDVGYRDGTGDVWARQATLGADDERAVGALRRETVKVLYVGRVSVEKNLPMLTALWPRMRAAALARGADAQLVVIGDGPYRGRMQRELGAHGAHFLGFRHGRELSTLYATADLFVFPSTTDTLGQVVMEAQSVGLPVVVTDQGGPGEVVDHGRTGFVLPVSGHGWEEKWVECVSGLIADHERRRAMGRDGIEKMRPMTIRHSFEHFWSVHERVHAEWLERGGAVGAAAPGAMAGAAGAAGVAH